MAFRHLDSFKGGSGWKPQVPFYLMGVRWHPRQILLRGYSPYPTRWSIRRLSLEQLEALAIDMAQLGREHGKLGVVVASGGEVMG